MKDRLIDPCAIVHPSANLSEGVTVGPYSIIGEGVNIGKNTAIGPHVVISERTTIGESNIIFQFASIGAPPQDVNYKGEKTFTIIGDNNIIREFVTIHRASAKAGLKTVCGNNNFFMNYVHIAHDCIIGNSVIMANAATLAGHVTVGDYAVIGGLVAVHQYVNIGAYCMIGGVSAVSKDIPPYALAVGNRAYLCGLNSIGLRRRGFSKKELDEIKRVYAIFFRSSLSTRDALGIAEKELGDSPHGRRFIEFIKASKRGVARVRTSKEREDVEE